jgi:type IX secretion system PorP/SprF family membrane protein
MFKRVVFLILQILITVSIVKSQQLPINNQYLVNKYSLSPAFAGFSKHTEGFLGYRQNLVGVKGAPSLAMIDVNGSFLYDMGYGASVYAERTGNFMHFYMSAAYAYHIKLGSDVFLSFGLEPKLYRNQLDISNVNSSGTIIDPLLQNNESLTGTTVDVGAAVLFKANGFIIGISAPRTLGLKMNYSNTVSQFQLKRHYLGHISYDLNLGTDLILTPLAVVRTTETSKINYEGSVLLEFKERLWMGAGYKASNSVSVNAGGSVSDWLIVNYCYDFGFAGITGASAGSHEITLGFLFNRSKDPRSPSVFPSQAVSGGFDPELEKRIDKLEEDIDTEEIERKEDVKELKGMIKDLEDLLSSKETKVDTPVVAEKSIWIDSLISNNIIFGKGSDRLLSSSFSEIDKYSQKLIEDEELKILIVGHTDNIGSSEYNKSLSTSRAKAISEYLLLKSDIEAEQVVYEGKGENQPLYDNLTPEGRRKNNRVVFKFNKSL